MKVVAFETSTSAGSVALVDDGVVLGEAAAQMRGNHSDVLLPMLEAVLARAGLPLSAVELLAVGVGPGSFTGVRVGLATAKGLRVATGLPLVGVGSLHALTAAAVGAPGVVAAVLDARRDELFAMVSRVDPASGGRTVLHAPWLGSPEQVGRRIRELVGPGERVVGIGDLTAALWARVTNAADGDLSVAPLVAGAPLARFVAHEALAGRGLRDDAAALEPVYVRPSDAKLPATAQRGGPSTDKAG